MIHNVRQNLLYSRAYLVCQGSESQMMRLRGKNKKWYAAFRWRGQQICMCLNAYEHERALAARNLGRVIEQLERGDLPGRANRPVISGEADYRDALKKRSALTAVRCEQILRLHLLPFFGKRTFSEVTAETVIEYKTAREATGATASTLKKELREFRNLVQLGNPNFEIPSSSKDVRMKFKNRGKTERSAPSLQQVLMVADRLVLESAQHGAAYRVIFLIQAYTAFRAGTARELKRCEVDLVGGWIDTIQSKVGQRVRVPICKSLAEVFKTIPRPITIEGKYFPAVSGNAYKVAVRRAFRHFGINASSKSLRHYAASALYNAGFDTSMVGKILGHSPGSSVTGVYIHPDERKIQQAFKAFDLDKVKNA